MEAEDQEPREAVEATFGPVSEHTTTPSVSARDVLDAFVDPVELGKRLDDPELRSHLVQRIVVEHPSVSVRVRATTHPNCPPAALSFAAKHPDSELRAAAARHPRCPQSALARLVEDTHHTVVTSAARNPTLGSVARAGLAFHHEASIRRLAALGPLTAEAIARLAVDDDEMVRQSVAGRFHLTPTDVSRLCEDPSPTTRLRLAEAILDDPFADPRVLDRLGRDPDPDVRAVIARRHGGVA